MTIAYSNFRGVTGKHGWSISRWVRQNFKIRLARLRRKRRQAAYRVRHGVTTAPRHTRAHHNKQRVRNPLSSHSWR